MKLQDLRPGDIGFGPIHGPASLLVTTGQAMLGESFRVGGLNVQHVFMITEALHDEEPSEEWPTGVINKGSLVEAMPGGAVEVPIMLDRWTPRFAYARLPEDYSGQGSDAAAIARAMVGTPYSFASYGALALWRWGIKTPRLERWIGRQGDLQAGLGPYGSSPAIRLPKEAICSVLVDQAWSLTGKKIMESVPHQCVTPGALAARLLTMDDVTWIWPRD